MNAEKKSGNKIRNDKQVHRMFQLGAVVLLGFVIHSLYISEDQPVTVGSGLTEEQVNQKVKEALDKMSESPQFKKVKDFVMFIESKADKENGNILPTTDGIIVYIPNKFVSGDNNKVEIMGEGLKINVTSEKISSDHLKSPEANASESSEAQ